MSTQKEHKCPVCPYSDNSITIMQVHCINVHPRGFVTCPWCTAPFGTISALKCHREQCSKFNKRDPREGDVNHRVALLTNNKCSLCEGRFHTQETAIRHYKELHLNFVYFCGVCKQHFEKLSNMKKHEAESHRKTPTDSFAASPANRKRIVADVSLSEKRCFTKWFNSKRCYDCKIGFESIAEVSEHFKMEHHTTYYDCDECGNAYLSLGARCKHKKLKHQPRRTPDCTPGSMLRDEFIGNSATHSRPFAEGTKSKKDVVSEPTYQILVSVSTKPENFVDLTLE